MSSSAPQVKAAVVALAGSVWPDAATYYGPPGIDMPRHVVSVGNARSTEITRPTNGGTRASRNEIFALDVILSVYVPGDHTEQQAATEEAFTMMAALDDYLRIFGNQKLGGICRDSWISGWELAEAKAANDENTAFIGRFADLAVTLTVDTRI